MLEELKKKFYYLLDKSPYSIEECRKHCKPEIEACYKAKHTKMEIENALRQALRGWVEDVAKRLVAV